MSLKTLVGAMLALLLVSPVFAASAVERITDSLRDVVQAEPDAVEETPMEGLYQVIYGSQLFYVSADGRFLLEGNLIDLQSRRNLSEDRRGLVRHEQISEMAESDMVIYRPTGEVKHSVTIFTDVDCPYCVRIHEEVPELLSKGVQVRYLAFPRAGDGSSTHRKMVSVWCADDRNAAMDRVKGGGNNPVRNCENPVNAQHLLGQAIGVRGTPAIITESGRLIPGYLPAARLLEELESE